MFTMVHRRTRFSGLAAGAALAMSTATIISGCAVQARVYAPPPPRVYVEPPVVSAAVVAPGVTITATEAPPPLPEYEQPPCPEEGYIWTPGYWHYGAAGYYWVPGTWVQPPSVGLLWTPAYWGFAGGVYGFHAGYWGPHVGFYGGVNYGFGYVGVGFAGGRWDGGHFAYNTSVTNVNTTIIHNTYNRTVINNVTVNNRVSFNGGAGGTAAVPTAEERSFAQERHIPPTATQVSHIQEAARNPALSARTNGGHPAIAATVRPGAFSGAGVVGARGAVPLAARPANAAEAPRASAPNERGPTGGAAAQANNHTPAAAAKAPGEAQRAQARPEPKAQPKPESRPQGKPQAKPQQKPKPAPKPAAQKKKNEEGEKGR